MRKAIRGMVTVTTEQGLKVTAISLARCEAIAKQYNEAGSVLVDTMVHHISKAKKALKKPAIGYGAAFEQLAGLAVKENSAGYHCANSDDDINDYLSNHNYQHN